MAVSISQVFFEHHYPAALGIGETEPRISWRFSGSATNWTQDGYSIEVARGREEPSIFDVESSDQSLLVPWPTVPLSTAEKAQVRVRARGTGDGHDTDWSEAYSVETGLLDEEDWAGAAMIAADTTVNTSLPRQPVLFRREFDIEAEKVESARLYITAYGAYEAEINGKRVGDHVLAPGWQSYQYRHIYDTYDVTDLIKAGDTNAIGVQVGEGWYAGRMGGRGRDHWGDTIGALALLTVTSSDGTTATVTTDTEWKAGTGPLITSEIYDGENYDARLEQPGWSTADFETDDSWTDVKELDGPFDRLVAPDGPPLRRTEEVELVEVLKSPSGKTILDFGQNLVGWLQVKVSGPANTTITFKHVEVLEDGEIATRPLRTAKQTDTLTLSGSKKEQVWEPKFTYHGFRYVQVEGWPASTKLDGNAIKAVVVHSDMEETGSFKCSHNLLNKLHQNIRWSMKGNFFSVPTDCPQRDERLGWTGDAHAFAPTANFLYDTSGFWKSWLKDVYREQKDNNGAPPHVVPKLPSYGTGPTTVWGDVIVANPWTNYLFFADTDALEEQYVGAKLWIDEGIPRNSEGLWERGTFQYGDWLDPLAPPDEPGQATTSNDYVADAYLVYITGLLANMAKVLSKDDDASTYQDAATSLKEEFAAAWITDNGTVANETQTGLVLPLWFDLFPDETQTASAATRLESIIKNNDYLVGTGFAGTHLLGPALTKHNLTDVFYKMLTGIESPSWLYQVVSNATTTWERWDSLLPDGSVNPGSMTSFNHYAFGSVGNWMYRTIGGLAPKDPGWKVVEVKPEPGEDVTEAQMSYLSPYGEVSVSWKSSGGEVKVSVVVPPNAAAEVWVPGEEEAVQVGSGEWEFTGRV